MTRKSPVAVSFAAGLLLAGCASLGPVVEKTETPQPLPSQARTLAAPTPKPTPRLIQPRAVTSSRVRPPEPAAPQTSIRAAVVQEGSSLIVTRDPNAQPVPLFRQAIVLANVRAAVAGLPVQPKAEFQRGLLTLTFPAASRTEVAAAINQALAIPEVTRLRADLPQ